MSQTKLVMLSKLMRTRQVFLVLFGLLLMLALLTGVAAAQPSSLTNGDFEYGSLDGWIIQGDGKVVSPGLDPMTGDSLQMVAAGQYAAIIGDETPWANTGPQSSSIEQEITVPSDADKSTVLQFVYAVVANDPPDHDEVDKPNMRLLVEDVTVGKVLTDTKYLYSSQTSTEWYIGDNPGVDLVNAPFYAIAQDRWVFRPWKQVSIPLANIGGHKLRIYFEVSDCNPTAHAAYGYLDEVHIGQPYEIPLPDLQGNPQPASYVAAPFWAPLMLWEERSKILCLCLCIPLLLYL